MILCPSKGRLPQCHTMIFAGQKNVVSSHSTQRSQRSRITRTLTGLVRQILLTQYPPPLMISLVDHIRVRAGLLSASSLPTEASAFFLSRKAKKTVLIVNVTARQSLHWASLRSPGGSVAKVDSEGLIIAEGAKHTYKELGANAPRWTTLRLLVRSRPRYGAINHSMAYPHGSQRYILRWSNTVASLACKGPGLNTLIRNKFWR
jgi:hypothetical protein